MPQHEPRPCSAPSKERCAASGVRKRGKTPRCLHRHCERSEAIQSLSAERFWIASSQGLLAMTEQGAASPSFNAHFRPQAHAFALSRLVSPELCFIAHPLEPRERREGRVLTTHPRSAAQNAHAENRTAAYRWCRSLGLPCAMVGRLMPRSPGSRVPSGLPRPGESHRHRAG